MCQTRKTAEKNSLHVVNGGSRSLPGGDGRNFRRHTIQIAELIATQDLGWLTFLRKTTSLRVSIPNGRKVLRGGAEAMGRCRGSPKAKGKTARLLLLFPIH